MDRTLEADLETSLLAAFARQRGYTGADSRQAPTLLWALDSARTTGHIDSPRLHISQSTLTSAVVGRSFCRGLAQANNCRAPTTVLRMVQSEGDDLGMVGEDRVHGALQVADAFAVNDPNLEDSALLARRQVVHHEVFDLARLERVQVQHAVDGDLDWLVHRSRSYSVRAVCHYGKRFDSLRPPHNIGHGTQDSGSGFVRRATHCRLQCAAGRRKRRAAPGRGYCSSRRCRHAERPGQRHLLRRRSAGRGGGAGDDHLRVERLAQRQHVVDPERVRETGVPARRGIPRAVQPPAQSGPVAEGCVKPPALCPRGEYPRPRILPAPRDDAHAIRGLRPGRSLAALMRTTPCKAWLIILVCLAASCGRGQGAATTRELVQSRLAQEYPSLLELYKHLHSHPELSFQEVQSAARVAEELRKAGCDVRSEERRVGTES